jgi:hypothetical protein
MTATTSEKGEEDILILEESLVKHSSYFAMMDISQRYNFLFIPLRINHNAITPLHSGQYHMTT